MSLRLTRYAYVMTLLGISLGLTACTRPRTQIMLRLGTDMTQGAGNELPAIRVQVTGEEAGAVHYDQTLQLGTGGITLPQELGLVPAKSKSALVTVQVDALNSSGGVIFTKRVSTRYVEKKTLLLDVFLASRCLDTAARVCPSDQSCGAAGCEGDTRPNLPEYEGPPTADGGSPRDLAVVGDLAGADLNMANDLNVAEPDLFGADLIGSDFTVVAADMAVPPDLITLDLRPVQDFSGLDLSAAPVITNLAPANVVLGIDGLTITGMRLVNGTTSVTINGVAQTILSSSATEIVIAQVNTATPPGNNVEVVVLTDAGPGIAPINILPRLAMTKAESKSATSVEVTFNRALNAGTVQAGRFTVAGLTVNTATATGAVVTLTTSTQVQGAAYALHVAPEVFDTFGTAAIDHLVAFGGPLPTEFVLVINGNGAVTGMATAPVKLERRSLASPATLVDTLQMPSYEATTGDMAGSTPDLAGPIPFTLMYTNTAEGALSRSPDGKSLAFMGYQVPSNVPGGATPQPPSGASRAAAIVDASDFGNPTGVQVIPTGLYDSTNAQARAAVVDGNNLWVIGGSGGVSYRAIDNTGGSFTNVSTGPSAGRVMQIWNGQLFTTSSIGGGFGVGLYQIGVGKPTSSVAAPTDVLDGDADLKGNAPYGYAFFDVGDEPGIDLLYLFDESAGIKRFAKETGNWNLKTTFSGGIRQGTCYLDGADVVCIGNTSSAIYVVRDTNHSSTGNIGTPRLNSDSGYQFRGLALAPVP